MNQRPAPDPPAPAPLDRRVAAFGGLALGLLGLLAVGLVALVLLARNGDIPGAGGTPADAADFAYAEPSSAPPLELTDQDGRPFTLDSLRGRPVLVFFGYTHCPDVCPATVGTLNEALAEAGPGPRAVFVSIDPDRDGPAAMASYLRYLPSAYTGLSGTPEEIRQNATGWGVKYAKVDVGAVDAYSMAHTADVFLIDAAGRLRARFPFGTEPAPIAATLSRLLAESPPPSEPPVTPLPPIRTPAPPTPSPVVTPAPPNPVAGATTPPGAAELTVFPVSSSIWAGGHSPVIFTLTAAGTPLDGSVPVVARVVGANDTAAGPDVPVVVIRPEGAKRAAFVATVDIPSPGWWRLDVDGADGSHGSATIEALDPGSTAPLGAPAPDVDTPTLDDVGGNVLAVTTQPVPDLRLSETSIADARAAGRPYVLVVDSARFQVSTACGRALSMVRYLLDRWTDVTFAHLEPFKYQIITNEPILSGDISNPPLDSEARAFGLGEGVWPATRMPWIFVVDGSGIVRAKYTGIIGSEDVDVILSMLAAERAPGT